MKLIEKFLNKLSLDDRITDGIFRIENNQHLDIFQEYLENMGADIEEAVTARNRMVEGKYPERQAYNANGILVTFPTPEYKQKAIERGTHFENNPKKQQPNVSFGDTKTPETEPVQVKTPEPTTPPTTEPIPKTVPPIQPPVQPPTTKTVTAPVMVVSPGEIKRKEEEEMKKAQSEYVEKLLKTEVYTLDEAKQCHFYNKGHRWYTSDGSYVGIQCFDESANRIVIKTI